MDTSDFKFIFLGQSVLKYQVPLDVYTTINDIYEKRRHELYPANKQLVGKIQNEHSLFFDGPPNNKMPVITQILKMNLLKYNEALY